MPADELDAFLRSERTCRVATISPTGVHNTPLWFAWDGSALWLYSIVRSQRWTDLMRDPHASVVVDAGEEYEELRGAELTGTVEVVGDVPRPADAGPDPAAEAAEQLFADKYSGGTMMHDGRHAWLRLVPDKISSWDFRKVFGSTA